MFEEETNRYTYLNKIESCDDDDDDDNADDEK